MLPCTPRTNDRSRLFELSIPFAAITVIVPCALNKIDVFEILIGWVNMTQCGCHDEEESQKRTQIEKKNTCTSFFLVVNLLCTGVYYSN